MRLFCLAFLFSLVATPSAAAGPDSWADLFAGPCARYDVPASLALAIARQESQFYPWAVNIQGKSYYPASRAEAVALLKKARGKSIDVGLMQVNSWWLRKLGISPETALEPRNNILIGVWILAQEIGRHGLTWKAVASYHTPLSRNPERGRRYAASVVHHLKQLSQ